jgi:alpha-tubulin suppressor-like RCC1 family protein
MVALSSLTLPLHSQQLPIVKIDAAPLPTPLEVSVRLFCASNEVITITKNGNVPSAGDTLVVSGSVITFGRYEILKARTWINGVGGPVKSIQYHHVTGAMAAGTIHSLASKSNGRMWTWGQQLNGRLGNNAMTSLVVSTPASIAGVYSSVSGGLAHSLTISPTFGNLSDSVFAFGSNSKGQLGQNEGTTLTQSGNPLPVKVQWASEAPSNLSDCRSVSAASEYSAALTHAGEVFTWGNQTQGRLGSGRSSGNYKFGTRVVKANPATPVTYLGQIVKVQVAEAHSLAVGASGAVWGWGDAAFGQLGQGDTSDKAKAIQLNAWNDVADVAAGDKHSLVLRRGPSADGIVFAAGLRTNGRLGYVNSATSSNQTSFVQVLKISGSTTATLTKIIQVAAGPGHSLALDEYGNVWAWGFNANGQLGLGANDTTTRNVAHQIPSLSNIVQVYAGGGIASGYSFAVAANGTVYAWGANSSGQLGLSNTLAYRIPTPIIHPKLTNQGSPSISLGFTLYSDTVPGSGVLLPSVTDPDGNDDVKRVDFYRGLSLYGSAMTAPWNYELPSLTNGNYQFLARAVDSYGDYDDSDPIQFTIKPTVSVTLLQAALPEGGNGAVFRISRSAVGDSNLSVGVASSGSAASSVDYVALSNFYVIPAGEMHVDIVVDVLTDTETETPENLILTITASSNYAIAPGGDDAELSIYDASFYTGDFDGDGLTGTQELEFGTDPTKIDSDGDGLADGSDAYPLSMEHLPFVAANLMVVTPLK